MEDLEGRVDREGRAFATGPQVSERGVAYHCLQTNPPMNHRQRIITITTAVLTQERFGVKLESTQSAELHQGMW